MRQDKTVLHASRTAATSSTQSDTPTTAAAIATHTSAQVSAAMPQQQQRVHKATAQPETTADAVSASALSAGATSAATEGETETENTPYAEHRVDMRCPNSILHGAQQHQMSKIDMALSASAALEGRSGSTATHKSHGQQTIMPNAVHKATTAATTKATTDCQTVRGSRLPAFDKHNDNNSKNKGISSTLLIQQQQQQRTVATTKSTPEAAEKADSAFHTSNIFTAVCRGYNWTSSKDRTNSKMLFQLLNMIFFMLCLVACALAMYSIVRHSRNEQRLRQVLQLDERISALELRLQLCDQRQQHKPQHFDLDTNRPLNNERTSPELDTGDLHNQPEEPPKQMSVDVTQTLQRLSQQVSDLHRLRRDVSHLQMSRRQQQRRQASLAAATTTDGLLLQTPQQTHSGECGCTTGE